MRVVAAGLIALCLAYTARSASQAAFEQDGYQLTKTVSYKSGLGQIGTSINATILDNGKHKRVYYLEGDGYTMGYLTAQLAEPEASDMCGTFIQHIVPQFLDQSLDRALYNNPTIRPLYDEILDVVVDILVDLVIHAYTRDAAAGLMPSELVAEMHGLADGALAVNANTSVTFEKLVTMNYGIDFLVAHVYTGNLTGILQSYVLEQQLTPSGKHIHDDVRKIILEMEEEHVRLPIYCDAFAASGAATKSGSGSFFARDFQFETAFVFQDAAAMFIRKPTDGRYATVSVGAPGFIGAMTSMNTYGVAMGVDMLPSAACNVMRIGVNSLLLVRTAMEHARNTSEAIEYVAALPRGTAWLYPVSDASGHGAIIEAGAYTNSNGVPDMLSYINDPGLRAILPDAQFFAANSPVEFKNGIFVREMDYEYPETFLQFNEALFNFANVPYNASAWGQMDMLYPQWTEEDKYTPMLGQGLFAPQRESSPNIVLATNFAITPQMLLTEMTNSSRLLTTDPDRRHWRYDSMNRLLLESYGSIDFEVARDIITFLSPERSVDYWKVRLYPDQPGSTLVQAAISVCDLQNRYIVTKTGYWADEWTAVTLMNYV